MAQVSCVTLAENLSQPTAEEKPLTPAKAPNVRYPVLQLGLALAVSGTVGAFVLEAGVDAFTAVFWRCAFGSLFLALWSLAFGYLPDRGFQWSNVARAALAGAFLALCWVCFFTGIQMTSISTATIVFQSYAFLLVLAGILVLGERASLDQFFWLLTAFIGVPLASGAIGMPMMAGGSWMLGALLSLAAAGCYVVITLVVRSIKGQRPEVTMMYQAIVGALMLSVLADFTQEISLPSWGWLIGIGVIHSGLVMAAMYATFPLLQTPVIAIMNFVYPGVAILIDWLFYGHHLGLMQWFGLALIVLATLGINLKWQVFARR